MINKITGLARLIISGNQLKQVIQDVKHNHDNQLIKQIKVKDHE